MVVFFIDDYLVTAVVELVEVGYNKLEEVLKTIYLEIMSIYIIPHIIMVKHRFPLFRLYIRVQIFYLFPNFQQSVFFENPLIIFPPENH